MGGVIGCGRFMGGTSRIVSGANGLLRLLRLLALFSFLALFLMLSIMLSTPVSAVGIGVNKGVLSFEDVLQNGYAQEEVLVTTDSVQPITGTYQLEGDISDWLRIEPNRTFFNFSRDNPYRLRVIVEPPPDAQLKSYSGGVRVLTGEVARTAGGLIGTTTRAAFLIRVKLGVTGTQRKSCTMGGVQIKDTEVGQPYEFTASVKNNGNVRIRPNFNITVYDQSQTELMQETSVSMDHDVLPTVTETFTKIVSHKLPVGQYWARVKSECGESKLLTFDVLERGGVSDKGELVRVEADPWAKTGEIIPIYAVFKNMGSRTVGAKFKGTITVRDTAGSSHAGTVRLVKTIDTDIYNVPAGQSAKIETFFNPSEPGRYVVAGRVLYNGKLTFQKSTIINVQGPMLVAAKSFSWVIILIFIIIILLLLIIAKKRRRRR